jgi:alpha-tubulin suppressor-like RCC1 family protein
MVTAAPAGARAVYRQTNSGSDVPVAVEYISTATAVTADGAVNIHSYDFCVLLSTGGVRCWGDGSSGSLGNGTFSHSDVPRKVQRIKYVATVIGGTGGFCALVSAGHLACWGANSDGQLGNGTTTNSDYPVGVEAAS